MKMSETLAQSLVNNRDAKINISKASQTMINLSLKQIQKPTIAKNVNDESNN